MGKYYYWVGTFKLLWIFRVWWRITNVTLRVVLKKKIMGKYFDKYACQKEYRSKLHTMYQFGKIKWDPLIAFFELVDSDDEHKLKIVRVFIDVSMYTCVNWENPPIQDQIGQELANELVTLFGYMRRGDDEGKIRKVITDTQIYKFFKGYPTIILREENDTETFDLPRMRTDPDVLKFLYKYEIENALDEGIITSKEYDNLKMMLEQGTDADLLMVEGPVTLYRQERLKLS